MSEHKALSLEASSVCEHLQMLKSFLHERPEVLHSVFSAAAALTASKSAAAGANPPRENFNAETGLWNFPSYTAETLFAPVERPGQRHLFLLKGTLHFAHCAGLDYNKLKDLTWRKNNVAWLTASTEAVVFNCLFFSFMSNIAWPSVVCCYWPIISS